MAEHSPISENHRPTVRVLLSRSRGVDLQPVFWGLEEEGIPVETQESTQGDAVALAKEAAHMSPLNVGIAVDGVKGVLALHHRDLPADHPLFVLNLHEIGSRELRRLGINAARLVKSEPLVLQDDVKLDEQITNTGNRSAQVSDELVERIVQSVLAELAKA